MTQPDEQPIDQHRLIRLVFIGAFCLWAKPRLPPDIASADHPTNPTNDSGRDAVVVSNHPVASGDAADIARLQLGDGYLRSIGVHDCPSVSTIDHDCPTYRLAA